MKNEMRGKEELEFRKYKIRKYKIRPERSGKLKLEIERYCESERGGIIEKFISGSLLILLTLSGMLLTSCAPFRGSAVFSEETTEKEYLSAEEIGDGLISVGFSQLGSESQWRSANTNSIEEALSEENGFFLLFQNARQKQENQIKAIRSYISQNVDYIVFSPLTEDGWTTVLKEARKAEIPVILVDRSVDSRDAELYTSFIGEDMEAEGRSAGLWLEEELTKTGREAEDISIVVLRGTRGSSAQRGRSMGFDRVLEKHENWHIVRQVDGEFTTAKAKEAMAGILRSGVRVDVLLSQNDDMTFGALEAMEEAGYSREEIEEMKIISFDACKRALELVRDSVIDVDIECNPESGELLRSVIHKIESGEPVEKSYYMEDKVFTRENVEDYIENRKY